MMPNLNDVSMAKSEVTLVQIQAWFMTAISHADGYRAGLHAAQQMFALNESALLKPGHEQASRLPIYASGYLLRLQECLEADYPVLMQALGKELFHFFCRQYLAHHPSRSPSLFDLGAGFPKFLQQSQPSSGEHEMDLLFAFPVELAFLERAYTEVLRAPGLETLSVTGHTHNQETPVPALLTLMSDLQAPVALNAESDNSDCPGWSAAPCLRLLSVQYPLADFWHAAKSATESSADLMQPEPQPGWLALSRIRYRVLLHTLQEWQFHVLYALQQAEAPVNDMEWLAGQVAVRSGLRTTATTDALVLWLPVAAQENLVVRTP
ncbi:putative DNA-binding domain-containing protein [Undibacterium sp. CY7W]|uniref:DNA-binding domain-containing protein n=1 Tax=Undibacterium rugosum TaxID=2762291 RepID=A0A923I3I6_9BURK|nr:DNA-binding domain-containing protein [Undibacterium rugosum]MBC3935379.1 putative DNA-binding domain-containing protein [Undibacterium rugosum]